MKRLVPFFDEQREIILRLLPFDRDESPAVRELQYRLWRDFMTHEGEDGNYWYGKHMEKDHPAQISSMLSMFTAAGFEAVGCFWRYLNFAILRAGKASGCP